MNEIFSFYKGEVHADITISGDKSISHRAVILSSLASGVSTIRGLLESSDVFNTINVFREMGVVIVKEGDIYYIDSKGPYSFEGKQKQFYMGNSGTSCRLIAGVLAALNGLNCVITGDISLSKRPMARIIKPLKAMGAKIEASNGQYLPMTISGSKLASINYTMEVDSAQVKSCLLLAGLFAEGNTVIKENNPTRDHTEKMLINLGVPLVVKEGSLYMQSYQKALPTYNYEIPSDFSSASFFIALALISKDSEIIIRNVNLNPLRTGLLEVLFSMGADISISNRKILQSEEVGDIKVKNSQLKATIVSYTCVSKMIDEFPILAVIVANAEGVSEFRGIGELRYKESDRINSIVVNLKKLGIKCEEQEDSLKIWGSSTLKEGRVTVDSFGDHRIAMSFVIFGACTKYGIRVLNCENINTSFPEFYEICSRVNLNISTTNITGKMETNE